MIAARRRMEDIMGKLEVVAMVVLSSSVSPAFADKLSEFKDADRYDEGCVTIP